MAQDTWYYQMKTNYFAVPPMEFTIEIKEMLDEFIESNIDYKKFGNVYLTKEEREGQYPFIYLTTGNNQKFRVAKAQHFDPESTNPSVPVPVLYKSGYSIINGALVL